ncbi:hypothetical protein ACQPXS_03000 [Streptomyces sp. CA-142005]
MAPNAVSTSGTQVVGVLRGERLHHADRFRAVLGAGTGTPWYGTTPARR